MKLLTALQKESRELTKAKANPERQLNAISAAAKAFASTLAADSANDRKAIAAAPPMGKAEKEKSEREKIAEADSGPKTAQNLCNEESRVSCYRP